MKEFADDIKTSNDKKMAATVNTFVDALLNEDEAAATKIIEDLVKYNQDAIKANEQYKVILPDGFKQAVKLEIRSRKLGVSDPRAVPKAGREQYFEELDETLPEDSLHPSEDEEP